MAGASIRPEFKNPSFKHPNLRVRTLLWLIQLHMGKASGSRQGSSGANGNRASRYSLLIQGTERLHSYCADARGACRAVG